MESHLCTGSAWGRRRRGGGAGRGGGGGERGQAEGVGDHGVGEAGFGSCGVSGDLVYHPGASVCVKYQWCLQCLISMSYERA